MSNYFLLTGDRREPINLERPALGSGGEADIYRVPQLSGCVAKIYHGRNGAVHASRPKLLAMLARPPEHLTAKIGTKELPLFAWPTHLVEDEHGACVGFLMQEVPLGAAVQLSKYTSRRLMRQALSLDDCSLPRRVLVCRNLAAAIAEMHRQQHFFVDLKPQNIFIFKDTGIVCLVDNDSFSIAASANAGRFPASVFTPQYQAPEIIRNGMHANSIVTDTQDRFALAVLIFQILNNGQHPFQGVPQITTEEWNIDLCVREGYYPHARVPHRAIAPSPASVHESLDDGTLDLFTRAFTGQPSQRPSAEEWRTHFDRLHAVSGTFTRCGNERDNVLHIHFQGKPCPECKMDALDTAVATKQKTVTSHPSASQPVFPAQGNTPAPVAKSSPSWLIWIGGAIAALAIYSSLPDKKNTAPAPTPAPTPAVQPNKPTAVAPPSYKPPAAPSIAPAPAPISNPPPATATSPQTQPDAAQLARDVSGPEDTDGMRARGDVYNSASKDAFNQNLADLNEVLRLASAGNDAETFEAAKTRMRNVDFMAHFSGWKRHTKTTRDINEELALRTDYRSSLDSTIRKQVAAALLDPWYREAAGNLAFYLALNGKDGAALNTAVLSLSLPRSQTATGRSADWHMLGSMLARQGKADASRAAFFVGLAISSNLSGFCGTLLKHQADFGDSLKAPIDAVFKRIAERGQSDTPGCAYPPNWRN